MPPPNLFAQPKGPGISTWTSAAAHIPPVICAIKYSIPLSGVMHFVITKAKVTAGLNTEPETRKNIQMFIIKPIPDDTAMKRRFEVSIN